MEVEGLSGGRIIPLVPDHSMVIGRVNIGGLQEERRERREVKGGEVRVEGRGMA